MQMTIYIYIYKGPCDKHTFGDSWMGGLATIAEAPFTTPPIDSGWDQIILHGIFIFIS